MKNSWLVLALLSVVLVGCGEQGPNERKAFPELPQQEEPSDQELPPNAIPVVQGEVSPSLDGVDRPPRGPMTTLKDNHPELFE